MKEGKVSCKPKLKMKFEILLFEIHPLTVIIQTAVQQLVKLSSSID